MAENINQAANQEGDYNDKQELYNEVESQITGLVAEENDWLANLANTTAVIYNQLPDLNWAGFYLRRSDGDLILGPFQGKSACVRISPGSGVCGTAVETEKPQLVPDVHEFPGHIVCDPESRSELVIPLWSQEEIIGVLDLDSPSLARFDRYDLKRLQNIIEILAENCSFSGYDFYSS